MGEVRAMVLRGLGAPVEDVGTKAHALDRLIAMGAPVPSCGVLTTHAYREFANGQVLATRLEELRGRPLPDIGDEADARRRVDEMFLEAPMPTTVRDAIDELVVAVGGERSLAIRSSATAEDLDSASFAGQYRSLLDVSPVDAERSVRLAWASLWHPAPRAYRAYHGVDDAGLAMALIVMPMLSPVVAGVAFTRTHAGVHVAEAEVMRIELVHGLGEGLVSGALTPEVFVVDRSGTDVGGLAAVAEPLALLPALAVRVEAEFGAPQDLEWAVEGERLWLLQARPITASDRDGTDDGFDVRPRTDVEWTTAGIAEMLPGVLPPRLWELDSWLVEEAFRRLFRLLGGDVALLADPHALIARYRARAALDLDAMRAEIATIPGGSPARLEQRYFGESGNRGDGAAGHAGLRQGVRLLRARNAAAQEAAIVVRVTELLLDAEPDVRTMDDVGLSAFRARLTDVAARAMAAEVIVAALAAAAYDAVEAVLARHVGVAEATSLAQRVTGSGGHPGNALTASLRPLVDGVRGTSSDGGDAAVPTYMDVRGSTHYRSALRRAGSRSVCGGSTWEEAPEQAWATFRALVGRSSTADAAARYEERTGAEDVVHSDPRWRMARAAGGMLADPRRAFLRREADDAAELLQRREQVKAAVLMIGGIIRRADLEIGRRLVGRGDLSVVDDVELLTATESRQLLTRRRGEPACLSSATISTRRRRLRSAELSGPLPRRFNGRTPPESAPAGTAVGCGWGASPGRYEGTARVVESPDMAAGFRTGDVLVARTTDASWMPLFLMAGAIVVEDGGPLSHAAIVARELGVPSIVNVPGIVDRLAGPADAAVLVDGTTGEIIVRDGTDDGPDPSEQLDRDLDDVPAPSDPVVGLAPVRSPPTIDSGAGLHVFVTGLIGAGALLSVVMSMAERVGGVSGRERLARRSEPVARTVAAAIVRGYEDAASSPVGLRPRWWYVAVATLSTIVAVAIGARSTAVYWRSDADSWRAVLAWSATMTSSVTVVAAAAMLARAGLRWPVVAPSVRRRSAPRSGAPGVAQLLGPGARFVVLASLAVVGVLAVLVTVRLPAVSRFDRWLYDVIGAGATADRFTPGVVNVLGRPIVVIPLAAGLALVARRCRTVALMIPAAIVGTGVAVFLLTWLTERDRPVLGAHAGEQNSFPGGHAAQLTLLAGLVILVVHVVTDRRPYHRLATVASGLTLVAALVDTVRTGGHWPTDQLAGFLVAIAVLVVVAGRARAPECHSSCSSRCSKKREPT